MNITDINIKLVEQKKDKPTRLKAIAKIIIDGRYELKNLPIVKSDKHLYVQFPRSLNGSKVFKPITKEAREDIEKPILCEYRRLLNKEDISIETAEKMCYNTSSECE